MSTNTPFATLFGGSDRSAIDLPVAALAGLAVAFAMFTIPDELLAEAVGATGIANVIAAAQPPLGTTARIVLAAAGAVAAFLGAFVLLRWLDRFALRASVAAPVVIESEGPRIRKSDAHPDAPPCRPISASRDLGEPAPPTRQAADLREPVEPAAEAPVAAAEPLLSSAASAPGEPLGPVPAPMAFAPEARPAPSALKDRLPRTAAASQNLGELMARLEHGLARRERAAASASSPAPAAAPAPESRPAAPPRPVAESPAAEHPAPPPPPTRSNDRLQSAMDGLRALSVRV